MNSFMCVLKGGVVGLCGVDFVSVSTTHDAVHVIRCNHQHRDVGLGVYQSGLAA